MEKYIFKKVILLAPYLILILLFFTACDKDDFFDRFPPEIMFYQYDQVETADFNQIILETLQNEYIVKARVSAPNKLAQIIIYRDNEQVQVINEFQKETEYWLLHQVSNIGTKVSIRIEATDKIGHTTVKEFLILKN